jgi:prephenate dehydratase
MKKISFQGEHGAYSEASSQRFFKNNIEPIPCRTFRDVLEETKLGNSDYGILPVENSIEGSVGQSFDAILSSNLHAVGEIYLEIHHCLISNEDIGEITTVYSHPQALGQCSNFIQTNSLKTVPTYDTAGSVKIIKELDEKGIAAIASKNAAGIYSVPIIKEKIENDPNNVTRFLIFSKQETEPTSNDKTSIIFSIDHAPSALYGIIKEFSNNNINLTKIESRPKTGTTWEYNFYLDFVGHISDTKVSSMLDELKKNTKFLKIIGSYPLAELS